MEGTGWPSCAATRQVGRRQGIALQVGVEAAGGGGIHFLIKISLN